MSCARDFVSTRVVSIRSADHLANADQLMQVLGVRELPVVGEEGRLVGIVTRSDLQPYRGHWEWTPVRQAMTPCPVTVAPDTPLDAVARLLIERGINAVPVEVDGRLVGMLRRQDLLRDLLTPRR